MARKGLRRGKGPLEILDENEHKNTMTVYPIFTGEDKCQVSNDKGLLPIQAQPEWMTSSLQ